MNPVLSLPPQPTGTGPDFQELWNRYVVEHARPAMRDYFGRFKSALEARGFSVVIDYTTEDTPYYLVIPVWQGTIEKNGVRANWTMTLGQAQSREPEDFAEHYATWVWGEAARASSNAGGPVVWTPSLPLNVLPNITPGPVTTTPTGGASSQEVQRPSDTNSGTVVSPAAPTPLPVEMLTFDGWNWENEQSTGRIGPAPEDVGVTDRFALITREQWAAVVGPWFASNGAGGASGGSGGGGGETDPGATGGGTVLPSVTDNTMLIVAGIGAAALALLAMKKG